MTTSKSDYPIQSWSVVELFLWGYVPKLLAAGKAIGVGLDSIAFYGDHLGLQVMNAEEFDNAHNELLTFCTMTHDTMIHGRRNRIYRFRSPTPVEGILFRGIEIFEPKPGANPDALRPGIGHAAFLCSSIDDLLVQFHETGVAVAKDATYNDGRFIKTELVDDIEFEFREQSLI